MYCRLNNYQVEEVIPLVLTTPRKELKILYKGRMEEYHKDVSKDFDNIPVKMDSLRYQVFALKGCVCITCGLEATHFGLEGFKSDTKKGGPFHFNLYGWRDGREVMFTKDHILPKSEGGQDIIENMQTMCSECNCEKGNKII